jgi:FixJ family two-component response regulator
MSKQKLLQRLVSSLATNHGVQPKPTEIWQRLKSLTPREVDVLCYVLGGQLAHSPPSCENIR